MLINTFCFSQDTLDLKRLEKRMRIYHNLKLDADLENYKNLNKLSWLLFIPGIGYDFINQNPYIVYNTSSLFSYFNQKIKQKHIKQSLILQSSLLESADLIKLNRYYLRFEQLSEEYKLDKDNFNIYSKLYMIKKNKYIENEINLETLLLSEIQLNSRKKSLYQTSTKLYDLILQIEMLTHSNLSFEIKKGKL